MTLDEEGDSLRVSHQEILEEEHAREDCVLNVLPGSYCIVAIRRERPYLGASL